MIDSDMSIFENFKFKPWSSGSICANSDLWKCYVIGCIFKRIFVFLLHGVENQGGMNLVSNNMSEKPLLGDCS